MNQDTGRQATSDIFASIVQAPERIEIAVTHSFDPVPLEEDVLEEQEDVANNDERWRNQELLFVLHDDVVSAN